MFISPTASWVVIVSDPQHKQQFVQAIERGAPKCQVHHAASQEEAYKLMAGFQQSGTLPDFVLLDAESIDSHPEKAVGHVRRLTENASPIVLMLDGTTHACKSYGANSCIDRSPESVAAAAKYWTAINIAKPNGKF